MLFPQEKRNTPDTPATPPQPQPAYPPQPQQPIYVHDAPKGGGVKIPILFGAVIALVGACIYLFYQLNQLRNELAETRDSFTSEIAKINETSSVTTQTSRKNMDNLKKELDRARAAAAQLSGEAKTAAT